MLGVPPGRDPRAASSPPVAELVCAGCDSPRDPRSGAARDLRIDRLRDTRARRCRVPLVCVRNPCPKSASHETLRPRGSETVPGMAVLATPVCPRLSRTRRCSDALATAGCDRIFADHASGALEDRAELARVLDHARDGDTLVVWRLDRLGRSLPPRGHRHGSRAARRRLPVAERVDRHDDAGRQAGLSHLRCGGRVRARPDPRTHPRRPRGGAGARTQRRAPVGDDRRQAARGT